MQSFSDDVYTAGAYSRKKLPSCNPHKQILKNRFFFRLENVKCFYVIYPSANISQ